MLQKLMFGSLSRTILQLICSLFLSSLQILPEGCKLRRIEEPWSDIRGQLDLKVFNAKLVFITCFYFISIHLLHSKSCNRCKLLFCKQVFAFFTFLQPNKTLRGRFVFDLLCWNQMNHFKYFT